MKKNQKLQELVSNQVSNAIETAKKETSKKNKKETSKVENSKSIEKKKKVVESVKEQQEVALLEEVVSQRDVKYIYPEGIDDTLSRKKWRQQTRNKLHQLEREMHRITDQNSKEYKVAKKKFEDFRNEVLKPQQVV